MPILRPLRKRHRRIDSMLSPKQGWSDAEVVTISRRVTLLQHYR